MQPALRPQGPPHLMRPVGRPALVPTGLPPPQRPPAGYRPSAPTLEKPMMMSSPINQSTQMMAEMNLNSPYSNQETGAFNSTTGGHTTLTNGVPDNSDPFSNVNQVTQSSHVAPTYDRLLKTPTSFIASSTENIAQMATQSLENNNPPTAGLNSYHVQTPIKMLVSSAAPTSGISQSITQLASANFNSVASMPSSLPLQSPLDSISPRVSSAVGNTTFPSQGTNALGSFEKSSVTMPAPRPGIPFGSAGQSFPPLRPGTAPLGTNFNSPSLGVSSSPNLQPFMAQHNSQMASPQPSSWMPSQSSPIMPSQPSPMMPSPLISSPATPMMATMSTHSPSMMASHPGMAPSSSQLVSPSTVKMGSSLPPYSSAGSGFFPGSNMPPHSSGGPGMPPPQGVTMMPPSGVQGMLPPHGVAMMPHVSGGLGIPPHVSSSVSPGVVQHGSSMMPPGSGPSHGLPMIPPASGPPHGPTLMSQGYVGPGIPPSAAMSTLPPGQQTPTPVGGMQNRYPGASPAGGGMGGYNQGQGRRLNPDDMPSPLQVMEEDRQCKSGEFITNVKGGVPPLVTTEFFIKDGGNASPHFIRSTMYSVPATPDMMKQASVPFSLIISPFADLHKNEAPLFVGTSLANGPVRCNRCKAYMSPLMVFMNGGRRFQCLLCKQVNDVPPEYHCHMDSQGARADKFQRPELCLGSYEFIATPEYCKDKILPKEPAFIFVMEMSQMMLQRGIINILCQNMKSILQHLPKDHVPGSEEMSKSPIRVGFITYDSSVHFYKLTGLAPEMCVLCDKEDMFVPVPDGILCDIEDVSANIDKLMECIPHNFQTTRETSGALYSAIQAGMSALKASGRAGKLFVFHSSLPVYEGIGKLKNREDRKLLGTDKENAILNPQNTQYNNLAQDLVSNGCAVELYVFNESYIDLATIGQVARLSGGQCYKYTYFQPNKDSQRFLEDLRINISRNIAFDGVMRVRTSTGVRPVEFYGHFFMSNTQDIELAAVDSNKAIAVEIKHDDKITEEDGVYIQVALLYTSVAGQRRLRILNLALNVCTQMADLYKNCELDALMNFFGKQAMFKFLESSAKEVKEVLITRTAQMLACYRKNCATPSSAGQLILPELMKLLPLYVNCLAKCEALSGGSDMTCDDRSWHIYQLLTLTVEASVAYFYPRLLPLTNINNEDTDIPPALRSSYEKLNPEGAYLLENGLFMFLWVGSSTPSSWMNDVFSVSAPHHLDPVLSELPELDNPVSRRVRGIISAVRHQRKQHLRLFVVPQQGKHEIVMRNYLIEDKGVYGGPSYVDFLCHVHKEIRALLS